MKATISFLFMCFCMGSFGAIIYIKDQPVPLIYKEEQYYLPLHFSISPGTKNLYITMDGMKKLCFLDTAPEGTLEQISAISIVINGLRTEWNCFPYKTTIIEVRP